MQTDNSPRIAVISALAESTGPAQAAMRDVWPAARVCALLDDALASDFASIGQLTPAIIERFLTLGRYAVAAHDGERRTAGIMFTCSAFGPAIDRVKSDLSIPVIAPNEGAFEQALDHCQLRPGGGRIGLLLTFAGSLAPLSAELRSIAAGRGQAMPEILCQVADGALVDLQKGCADQHDHRIAEAASELPAVDVVILGQFSMARAAPLVTLRRTEPVLTTPHAAARKLKMLVEQAASARVATTEHSIT
jgi:hypothetical protein